MSAIIRIGKWVAISDDETGEWECANEHVARCLNGARDIPDIPTSDPHPEETRARALANMFGGQLLHCDPPWPLEEGCVY